MMTKVQKFIFSAQYSSFMAGHRTCFWFFFFIL